jgi:hypothetical protein
MVETADAARLNGHFFEITQKYRNGVIHTVLTLRASDVVGAEILERLKGGGLRWRRGTAA